jgi:hypothetical protein
MLTLKIMASKLTLAAPLAVVSLSLVFPSNKLLAARGLLGWVFTSALSWAKSCVPAGQQSVFFTDTKAR